MAPTAFHRHATFFLFGSILVLCSPGCTDTKPSPATQATIGTTVVPISSGVRLFSLDRPASLRLLPVRDDAPRDSAGYASMHAISSSGPGTRSGTARAPVHIADVADLASGRRMKLYVIVESRDGWITRSWLAWKGDYIPGISVDAGPCGRSVPGEEDRMTCQVVLAVAGRPDAVVVFAGYDWEGKAVPPFGRALEEHAATRRSAAATQPRQPPTSFP